MSEYRYSISDTSDLANKLIRLEHRINIDPEITSSNLPVQSVVYSAPEVIITFNFPLVGRESYIVGGMVAFLFYDAVPGYTFAYNNLVLSPRDTMGGLVDPTQDHDIYSGYNVGSHYFIPSVPAAWLCVDASVGNAQWIQLTGPVAPSPITTLTKTLTTCKAIETGDFMGQGMAGDNFTAHAILAGVSGVVTSMCFSIRCSTSVTNLVARLWRQIPDHEPEPTELCVTLHDGNVVTCMSCEDIKITVDKMDLIAINITCDGSLPLGATACLTLQY